MSKFWRVLQSIGVHSGLSGRVARKVALQNRMTLVACFVFALQIILYITTSSWYSAIASIACLIAGGSTIVLHYYGFYRLGRWLSISLISSLFVLTMCLYGPGYGIEMSFLSITIAVMLLFDRPITRVCIIGFNLSGYFAGLFGIFNSRLLSEGVMPGPWGQAVVFCGNLLFIILAIDSFLLHNREVETQIEQANKELKIRNRDLETFTQAVSHHFKTAIRGINGFLTLAEQEHHKHEPISQTELHYLQRAKAAAKHLQYMVVDMLTLFGVSHDKESRSWISLNKIIAEVNENLHSFMEERSARLTVLPLPNIKMNEMHAQILLQNLIHNGLKYNDDPNPEVIISASQQQGGILLQVKDNGLGIPQHLTNKIFEPFMRLHTSDEYEGNGLGLAICQRIVLQYGGYIRLDKRVEVGSCFEIFLSVPVRSTRDPRGDELRPQALTAIEQI